MIIEKRNNQSNSQERKVLWMPSPLGDKTLHKMADLEVLRQLAKRKYRIYITGTISKEKVRRMGLQKQIVFMGFTGRNELLETYQNATVHIAASHYEGMPTVLLEAMSCGLPVVATNVDGNNEVISSGVNGFLVPPKSPKVMAKII